MSKQAMGCSAACALLSCASSDWVVGQVKAECTHELANDVAGTCNLNRLQGPARLVLRARALLDQMIIAASFADVLDSYKLVAFGACYSWH